MPAVMRLCVSIACMLLPVIALSAAEEMPDGMAGHGPATIVSIKANRATLPAFARFELSLTIDAEYENPFDPADVSLTAHFTTPSGRQHDVAGFLYWPCERSRPGRGERVERTGAAEWRVRYCPTEPGEYRYWIELDDGRTQARSEPQAFLATTPEGRGFIRVSKASPLYFQYDDGTLYYPVGENVCWPGQGGTYDYDNFWQKLADNRANYARLWIGPFDVFTLERTRRGQTDPAGLGRYDLINSWRLDYVIDEAEKRGIAIMFCIDSFNSLRISPDHAMWAQNPYSKANGGPLERPEQFFTDPTARRLFQQRLRYIVSRWGYSPAVMSWEFWNEVNIIEKYSSEDVAPWHRDMARYLRQQDPYAHLITTSWAGTEGDPAVDGLPEMDYIQSHQYGARDAAAFMLGVSREKRARYSKPHYFGEFGTGTRAEGTREDENGIHLHNGLWSGVMSGDAGTAMIWWWDNYVEPRNLYYHFRPVADFVKDVPFHQVAFEPAAIGDVGYAGAAPPPRLESLSIRSDNGSWQPAPHNQPGTFTVHPDGRLEPAERLSHVLHGLRNHPTLHNPATFHVDYSKPGKFIIEVSGVSGHGGAKLQVYLDDRQVLSEDFVDDDQSQETLTKYNGPYAIDVPQGKHTVRVVNDGRDWLFVAYTLTDYRRRNDPGIQVYGLVAEKATAGQPAALVWVKNERYNWYFHNQGEELRPVPPSRFTLAGLPDGQYEVQWWDTYQGKVTRREQAQSQGGRLVLQPGELLKDVACKVVRQ